MDSEIIGAIIAAAAAIISAIIGGWVAIKVKDMELRAKEAKTGQPTSEADRKSSQWLWGIGGAVIGAGLAFGFLALAYGIPVFSSNPTLIAVANVATPSPTSFLSTTPTTKPTSTPEPTLSTTPTTKPTSTPKPTSTSTPLPTPVSTPNIPIYDDFSDGTINQGWYIPSWENMNIKFDVIESEGALRFNNTGGWGAFLTAKNRMLKELHMLVTLEEATGENGKFGMFVSSPNNWYTFLVTKEEGIVLASSQEQGQWKSSKFVQCCPSTHLLGAKVDGSQVYFYVDGELVVSLPENADLWDPGFWIGGGLRKASVSAVWIKFAD